MSKPNIVFILTDQQRADTIAAHGFPHMKTPAQDWLAESGVSFSNAFCPGATCVPSRSAIFTGMYAHNTGCYTFENWAHHRTWIHDLRDAGYWCANIGKMHFMPLHAPGPFHERVVVENPTAVFDLSKHHDDDWGRFLSANGVTRPNHRQNTDPDWDSKFQCVPWHLEERLHSDCFVGDQSASWIDNYANEKDAFFLEVGFPGPHEPWDPPQRLLKYYKNKNFTLPESRHEDLSSKPPQHTAHQNYFANADGEARIQMADATDADIRNMQEHYFAKISFVDEQVQKVIDALERKKLLENTIIVFSSDHGEMLGEHRLPYKWMMYDSVVKVPLIIRTPEGRLANETVDDLVSLIDIGPTLLELAGIEKPTRLEGQSLVPALNGKDYNKRRHVYCENNYMTMCRDERWKLVHYMGQEQGELYNLEADPHEMNNLWDRSEYRKQKHSLVTQLFEWLASSAYHNLGYKCQIEDSCGKYGLRWPRPAENDYFTHSDNIKPPAVSHH